MSQYGDGVSNLRFLLKPLPWLLLAGWIWFSVHQQQRFNDAVLEFERITNERLARLSR